MHLRTFRLKNYTCFDSIHMDLGPGINVVVGRNNSGKSTLLKALGGSPGDRRKSLVDAHGNFPDAQERYYCHAISWAEFFQVFRADAVDIHCQHASASQADTMVKSWLEGDLVTCVTIKSGSILSYIPGLQSGPEDSNGFRLSIHPQTRTLQSIQSSRDIKSGETVAAKIGSSSKNATYLFRAERRVPPYSKSGSSVTLSSSCDNLPEVLSCFFQTRPAGRAAFQDLVTEVLPEVTHVATYPRQLNKDGGPKEVVEIRVFFYGGDPDNEDLSVRLDECGTGLGQVLTICYLLASSKDSRIILVDEPQSFLHPEASRRLMQVFDRFSSRHQFIVSTHSPEIIGAVRNCTLHHVKGGANGSMVRSSSSSEIERVREAFADVGVSLKDIFGFERVLWVEGETEESVFPLVLKAFHPELLAPDLVVKRVFATGDVDSKKCERLLHVYRSIASAAALAPTAVGIVLDREDRNPEKCAEYERSFRKAGVSLTFLPVPLLENWFLDAGALFSALSRDLAMVGAPERVPTLQAIEDELQALIAKAKITPKLRKAGATGSYECWIHGAKVIEELFRPYLVAYNKPRHGRAIATWLIDNDRAKLQSLADFLKRLLSGPRS